MPLLEQGARRPRLVAGEDPNIPTGAPAEGPSGRSAGQRPPDQSRAQRRTSYDPADFPQPAGREEEWRFTPVDRLAALLRDTPSGANLALDCDPPDGVTLNRITQQQARALGLPAPGDRAAALAVTHCESVLHLDVPVQAHPAEPIRVRLVGTHSERVWGHLVITVGRQAHATVVLEHEGTARYSQVVSVVAGDGADLTLVTLQEWDDQTLHVSQHDLVTGRDARIRHVAVTLGGSVVRLSTNVTYAGPGGSVEALGVYFADAGQHLEHRLFVDHGPAHCRSRVEYKGALQGDTAHTVWVGDVLIRPSAEGTDTYELNRNLVLTDGARADSVPNLEIETGEITQAGHASATGRFDDEQLFYLRSRGIPEAEARRLVVRGFFADVVSRIPVAEVQGRLLQAIENELVGAGA